jgi:tetratricopeptide (TPR) repeat protein
MKRFVLSLFILLNSHFAQANLDFQSGIKLYQEGQFAKAMEVFSSLAPSEKDSPANLYNWGLAAYKADQKGLALGLWRRALDVEPSFFRAEAALEKASKEMSAESFRFAEGNFSELKYGKLRGLSLDSLLSIHFLLFAFAGWLLIKYGLARRESLKDEKPLPPFPYLGLLFGLMFIVTSLMVGLRFSLDFESRATVTSKVASLRTGPQESANELFQTIEGMEFIIERVESGWALVTRPNGMTGWIDTSKLIQTSGEKLW